jgi:hypothetical protein
MDELLMFESVVNAGLSLLLFSISAVSFHRIRDMKLMFISGAFLLFFVKSVAALLYEDLLSSLALVDLIIIVMLYLAAARK